MKDASILVSMAAVVFSLVGLTARAEDAPRARAEAPWRVFGRVKDQDGRPMVGVTVRAFCGMGTLRCTGDVTSGADGRYEMSFGPGILFLARDSATTPQAATISARKPGFFEENLNRQGGCLAAEAQPNEEAIKSWGGRHDRVFLPGKPLEINFVMRPAARVSGALVDEQGQPLVGYGVGLDGADSPPSMGAVSGTETDQQGRFSLEGIPTTYRYQFVVRKANPKPPWDDSWASAAMRFESPEKADLRAWFGNREIRIEKFVLRVAGPGVHGREATPVAGHAGVLNLTTVDPTDVLERSDTRLVAKSALLTLRNTPRQDARGSLIEESVSAASVVESTTRLARTRPNEAGEFTISFENPRATDLVPGKHQVIFQVFVGASRRPIREKIFKQLAIVRDGRYQVPLKIAPEWIDDSRVSLTFVTIQPDHDAWVKSFFHDGKGTKYQGLWAEDNAPLPAVPFEARRVP
jgi:hypothetical protein